MNRGKEISKAIIKPKKVFDGYFENGRLIMEFPSKKVPVRKIRGVFFDFK